MKATVASSQKFEIMLNVQCSHSSKRNQDLTLLPEWKTWSVMDNYDS